MFVGLLVASYMLESWKFSGQIMFCRNKWESKGDASESTGIVLDVTVNDISEFVD